MVAGLLAVPMLIIVDPLSKAGFVVVTMIREAVIPVPNVPMVQTGAAHVPADGVALMTVKDEGIVSFTVMESSDTEPEFVTVIV